MPEYFTLDDFRAMPDMDNSVKYSDERIEASAAAIVGVIEREVGTSFIARTVEDEIHDGGRDHIVLLSPWVQSVTSATEDGVAVVDTLVVRHGILRKVSGSSALMWADGWGNVAVTYVSGYSLEPPADVKEMALKGTRVHLMATAENSSANARRTSLSTDMGVESFVVAGQDRPTGYPDVDAMILGWKDKLRAPSVA